MEIEVKKSKLLRSLFAIVFIPILIFGVILLVNLSGRIGEKAEASALRDEFGQSYKNDVDKTGKIKEVEITASETEAEIVDGVKTKVWTYNGTVPGPEIRINLGDTLRVVFTNNLPQETTIHWHGVRVPNAMDGVPGVTQDPIKPGDTFTYEFTPKDAGTFWFHPHVRGSEQVERGLFGTLIVEDEVSKKYSKDVVWVIDDWRMTKEFQVDPNFVTGHDLAHDGRWGNIITVNGSQNEVLEVQPGDRIRLRLVNSSNGRVYKPAWGNLDAKIIAVDGMYVKEPISAGTFKLAPGNRIDLDIKVPLDESEVQIYDKYTRYANKLAKINISGEAVSIPEFDYPTNNTVPDWKDSTKASVDKVYRLNARMGTGGIQWTINDKAFPDYDPFNLKFNEFNKIKFINESYRLHPMHLHGQFFKVISRNGKTVNEPYFRDTVLLEAQDTVEIGLVPMDKGKWVQHCHILEHADSGMLTVVNVN